MVDKLGMIDIYALAWWSVLNYLFLMFLFLLSHIAYLLLSSVSLHLYEEGIVIIYWF